MLQDKKWSLELISQKGRETGKVPVSNEWLYHWIWECKHGNRKGELKFKKLYPHLNLGRRPGKRGNRKDTRGIIPDIMPISKRPKNLGEKMRLSYIAVDLIIGLNHMSALSVKTERVSLLCRLKKLDGKNAAVFKNPRIKYFKKIPYPIQGLTFDICITFIDYQQAGKALLAGQKYAFSRHNTNQNKRPV